MLSKLLKYEFKASARLYGGMYLAILAAAALMGLRAGADNENACDLSRLSIMLTLAYVVLCIALVVVTLMTIVRRFKGNLLGREGYLMHTLPVTTNQLIGAKLLSSTAWSVCGILVGCISVVFALVFYSLAGGVSLLELASEVKQLALSVRTDWLQVFFSSAVVTLASGVALILCIYASIMVGHLAKKHSTLAGIGAFLGFSLVQSWGQNLLAAVQLFDPSQISQDGFTLSLTGTGLLAGDALTTATLWGTAAVYILEYAAFGLLYFALTAWLMSRKLDLE